MLGLTPPPSSFGAVLEEFEVHDALGSVIATKPERNFTPFAYSARNKRPATSASAAPALAFASA